ncbi:MAG: hypothetical protein HC875_26965 [Anaerolineales bacterium]|nr:hypothetical protein [Anaerolineales bacterium]
MANFEEQGAVAGVSRVLEGIALHYFGNLNNIISLQSVNLFGFGEIDWVLIRHKLMKAEVDDFVTVEIRTDLTSKIESSMLNRTVVYKAWNTKGYWVISEHVYANLVKRYGFKESSYSSEHPCRFFLCDSAIFKDDYLTLNPNRYVSVDLDEVYQPTPYNLVLPDKDKVVQVFNAKMRAELLGSIYTVVRKRL